MSVISSQLLALAADLAMPAGFAAPKGDVENGQAIFSQRCSVCHAVSKEPGGPTGGPNLVGLVGRKAGSQPDFPMYTEALKAYGVTWSVQTLNEFLIGPYTKVPGT